MCIFEITINDEVYVSSELELEGPIETQILESNLYGKNIFLKNEVFYHFTENGPQFLSRKQITDILINHEEN